MRIAQMLDTLTWGGAQQMQLFLVENLRPLGIDLTIISLRNSKESPLPDRLKDAGARVVTFDFPRLFSPISFYQVVRFLRRERFDLIHAYLAYSNIVGPLAGRLSGTPVIGSFRNSGADPQHFSPMRAALESFSLRYFADSIIANGFAVAEYGHKQVGQNVHIDILPNAIATDIIPILSPQDKLALRREIVGDADRTIILTVGRLTPQKGHANLLQAFVTVHEKYPDVVLVIAGGGSLLGHIKQQVHELGLDGSVFVLGMRNDAPRLLAVADLYVNASFIEGTAVSILEAMTAGLPVVATAVGDSPFLLEGQAGVLVPPNQSQALAEALMEMIASPERRHAVGDAARKRIIHSFSPVSWRKKLLNLYAQVTPVAGEYISDSENDMSLGENHQEVISA